ncbi:MAG: hypothetical protein ACYCTV_11035 [Leptospirales bacterium]
MIKSDSACGEYLILNGFLALFRPNWNQFAAGGLHSGFHFFESADFFRLGQALPPSVLPLYRARREYIRSLLAKNEIHGKNPYIRFLFSRIAHGRYVLNPALRIRKGEEWVSLEKWFGIDLLSPFEYPSI